MIMDVRGIEIFLAICENGGLTAAANSLGLTQAGVSQHLQKLEREIGIILMDSTVRPPRLTPGGEYLRRRGRALMGELDDIRTGISRYQLCDIPQLRLGVIESAASALLPQLVRRLSRSVGALSVTSGTTHPLLPELRAGELDLVLTSEQVDDDDVFCCEPLLAEPIVMVLPKDRPKPRDWEDIALLARELEFISYGSRRRLARIVSHQFARFGIEPRGHLEFDSSVALFDIVSSGAGWAATTPMCMLCAGMSENDLQIVPFPDVTPIRSINAIWMREREDTSIHMVTDICRTIFTELAPKLVRLSGGMGGRVQVLSE